MMGTLLDCSEQYIYSHLTRTLLHEIDEATAAQQGMAVLRIQCSWRLER